MAKAIREYSLEHLMERIEEVFNQNPGPIKGFDAVVQYDVYGEVKGIYQHYFKDGKQTIKKGIKTTQPAPCSYPTIVLNNFYKENNAERWRCLLEEFEC